MTKILHASDWHIKSPGNAALEERALKEFQQINPDVTIITGDLTSGRESHMQRARSYLDAIPGEKLVVPGNTDENARRSYSSSSLESSESDYQDPRSDQGSMDDSGITYDTAGNMIYHFKDYVDLTGDDLQKLRRGEFRMLTPVVISGVQLWVAQAIPSAISSEHTSGHSSESALETGGSPAKQPEALPRLFSMKQQDSYSRFQSHFGDLTVPILLPDVTVFGIDTNKGSPLDFESYKAKLGSQEVYFFKRYDGCIMHDQLSALDAHMRAAKKQHPGALNLLAIHHPIVRPRWSTDFGPFYDERSLLQTLPALGVHAVLAGHKHIPDISTTLSWDQDYATTLYHLTAHTLLDDDRKEPYTRHSYFVIEKEGADVRISLNELGYGSRHVAGFSVSPQE